MQTTRAQVGSPGADNRSYTWLEAFGLRFPNLAKTASVASKWTRSPGRWAWAIELQVGNLLKRHACYCTHICSDLSVRPGAAADDRCLSKFSQRPFFSRLREDTIQALYVAFGLIPQMQPRQVPVNTNLAPSAWAHNAPFQFFPSAQDTYFEFGTISGPQHSSGGRNSCGLPVYQ